MPILLWGFLLLFAWWSGSLECSKTKTGGSTQNQQQLPADLPDKESPIYPQWSPCADPEKLRSQRIGHMRWLAHRGITWVSSGCSPKGSFKIDSRWWSLMGIAWWSLLWLPLVFRCTLFGYGCCCLVALALRSKPSPAMCVAKQLSALSIKDLYRLEINNRYIYIYIRYIIHRIIGDIQIINMGS